MGTVHLGLVASTSIFSTKIRNLFNKNKKSFQQGFNQKTMVMHMPTRPRISSHILQQRQFKAQ